MSLRGEFFWRENFGCLREFWEIEEKLEKKNFFGEISREKILREKNSPQWNKPWRRDGFISNEL